MHCHSFLSRWWRISFLFGIVEKDVVPVILDFARKKDVCPMVSAQGAFVEPRDSSRRL